MKRIGKFPLKIANDMKDQSPEDQIKEAVKILKKGGIVIFPTDTVYGIGCRFDDKDAISRLYKIKKTPESQPFPILVSDLSQVEKLAVINKTGEELIKKYWPGALTIVLQSKEGKNKIGFRMPDSALIKSIIDGVGEPLIGTSANFHGSRAPRSYGEIDPDFIKLADFVLKGECQLEMESTVIDATVDPPKVLRQGAIKLV
ncbi:MAG TPA: L-threonylcarbamoyladenylate synthase [Patescibacteria group bacterium]|nr:L-threonylcarbamoyladenylate synthase [Patescibacteria group bacterium]